MTEKKKPDTLYTIVGNEGFNPPDYDRVVRSLSTVDLLDEKASGRGDLGYQDAVRAELDRRENVR